MRAANAEMLYRHTIFIHLHPGTHHATGALAYQHMARYTHRTRHEHVYA
jgi:hypothetical protein